MPGTSQKKTQKAKPKKQARKVKSTTVNVIVKNQAVAVNSKVRTGVKRAPRRKAAPAPAASAPPPAPMFYNSTPAPIIVRPPNFDIPPQYEPTKAPAINVQTIDAPAMPPRTLEEPTNLPSMSIDSTPKEVVLPYNTKEELSSMYNEDIVKYAKLHGIPRTRRGMAKVDMVNKIDAFQKKA